VVGGFKTRAGDFVRHSIGRLLQLPTIELDELFRHGSYHRRKEPS
jgi:hypothetical protein